MKKEQTTITPKYKTYIFDLYGTLVDIKTDEEKASLWENLAGIYSAYGIDYTPTELQKAYASLCREETEILLQKLEKEYPGVDIQFPEIRLERVFARLLLESAPLPNVTDSVSVQNRKTHDPGKHSPVLHDTSATINGKSPKELSVEELADSEWAYMIANTFRTLSRERLSCYKNTLSTLKFLRDSGCRLYLLSNAQGIFTRTELEMTGLIPCLDVIYISSEKQIKKPQPEFLEWLIKEYNIDRDHAVMVGNEMQCDMGIAKACNIPGIFLNTFEWSDKKILEELKKTGADPSKICIIKDGDISHILE